MKRTRSYSITDVTVLYQVNSVNLIVYDLTDAPKSVLYFFPQASKYLVLPSYVKDVRVKADQCAQSPTLDYFKKEESFELSLASRKSFEFVVSNYEGKFTGKQFKIRFLNKIKSGTSRVRYVAVQVTTKKTSSWISLA